jgi:hypothetical protein
MSPLLEGKEITVRVNLRLRRCSRVRIRFNKRLEEWMKKDIVVKSDRSFTKNISISFNPGASRTFPWKGGNTLLTGVCIPLLSEGKRNVNSTRIS